METLKQLSIDHLNASIKSLSENTRLTTIAEVTKEKNALLKLKFQRQQIEAEIEYHRSKIATA